MSVASTRKIGQGDALFRRRTDSQLQKRCQVREFRGDVSEIFGKIGDFG